MHTKIKINPVRWNDATTVTGGMIEKSILSSIESRQGAYMVDCSRMHHSLSALIIPDRKYEYAVYLSFAEVWSVLLLLQERRKLTVLANA